MLSVAPKGMFIRGAQFAAKSIRNSRLNGSVSDAKAARTARKSRIGEVPGQTPEPSAPFNPKIGYAGAAVAVAGLCIYSIQTDKEGALGKIYWGSTVEKAVSDSYQYLFGWVGQIFIPYEDKLLPDWPTDPVILILLLSEQIKTL